MGLRRLSVAGLPRSAHPVRCESGRTRAAARTGKTGVVMPAPAAPEQPPDPGATPRDGIPPPEIAAQLALGSGAMGAANDETPASRPAAPVPRMPARPPAIGASPVATPRPPGGTAAT